MLCSAPSARSGSGSNWLDRLRSAKGFSAGDDVDVDLDHFLSSTGTPQDPNPNPPLPALPPTEPVSCSTAKRGQTRSTPAQTPCDGKDLYGYMTGVLSDLFNMGECPPGEVNFARKASRKQANPRFFPQSASGEAANLDEKASSDGARRGENGRDVGTASVDSGCNLMGGGRAGEAADEEGGEKDDLVGYSRSEVTVIDTSCEAWKFEKVLFRRKNVWKVRDRKGKTHGIGRKKRKLGVGGNEDDGKKKVKVLSSEFGSSNENPRNGDVEISKEMADSLSKSSKPSSNLSESPRKHRRGTSSVVLIAGIPNVKSKKAKLCKSQNKSTTCIAR